MKVKSNMILSVSFMPGASMTDAVKEAKEKCFNFNFAYVEFEFNGVKFSVTENAKISDARDLYNKAIKSKYKHVCL